MPARYELHGVSIDSELPLDARPGTRAAELRFTLEPERAQAEGPPPGDILSELHLEGLDFWLAASASGAWTLRHPGICDAIADRAAGTVAFHPVPGADPGLLSILAAGSVLGHLLTADGALVLHASCVESNGAAIAIVGYSGSGKSTVAALLCAAGAQLVSDDVLRVDAGNGRPLAVPGATALRLRQTAAPVAGRIEGAPVDDTPDGRLRVRPAIGSDSPLPLAACLVPEPDPGAKTLFVERLDTRAALLELIRYPRVSGWQSPGPLRDHFGAVAALNEAVPVLRARVPWGPPFETTLGAEILAATDVELSAAAGPGCGRKP